MSEYHKEKVKSLVALRNNLFTAVIVLTSGVMGLFFVNIPFWKVILFVSIGGYFDILFLKNLLSINNDIEKYVEELK